jgi:ribosomal protein L12E/L44/L45/RPP1/RPP2
MARRVHPHPTRSTAAAAATTQIVLSVLLLAALAPAAIVAQPQPELPVPRTGSCEVRAFLFLSFSAPHTPLRARLPTHFSHRVPVPSTRPTHPVCLREQGACGSCWFDRDDPSLISCCCEPSCKANGDCCADYEKHCGGAGQNKLSSADPQVARRLVSTLEPMEVKNAFQSLLANESTVPLHCGAEQKNATTTAEDARLGDDNKGEGEDEEDEDEGGDGVGGGGGAAPADAPAPGATPKSTSPNGFDTVDGNEAGLCKLNSVYPKCLKAPGFNP